LDGRKNGSSKWLQLLGERTGGVYYGVFFLLSKAKRGRGFARLKTIIEKIIGGKYV